MAKQTAESEKPAGLDKLEMNLGRALGNIRHTLDKCGKPRNVQKTSPSGASFVLTAKVWVFWQSIFPG